MSESFQLLKTTRISDIPRKQNFYDVRVTGMVVGITNFNSNYTFHIVDFSRKHPASPHIYSKMNFDPPDKYFNEPIKNEYVLDVSLFPNEFKELDEQCRRYLSFNLLDHVSGTSYTSFPLYNKGIFVSGVIRGRKNNEYLDLIFNDRSMSSSIEGRKPKIMALSSNDKAVRWLFESDSNVAKIQSEITKLFDKQFIEHNISNFEKTLCAKACTLIVNQFKKGIEYNSNRVTDRNNKFPEIDSEDLASDFSEDEVVTKHEDPESQFEPDEDLRSFTENHLGSYSNRPWHAATEPNSQLSVSANDNSIIGDISDAESLNAEENNMKRRRVENDIGSPLDMPAQDVRRTGFDTPNFNSFSDLDKVSLTQTVFPYYVYAKFSSCLTKSYRTLIYNLRQDDIKPHITGLEFLLEDKDKNSKIIIVTVKDVPKLLSLSHFDINSIELPKIIERKVREILAFNKFFGILLRRFNQPLNGIHSSSIASWQWLFTDFF